ncbi:hypothetical protein Pmani_007624 [Petrolisthes manimaculis]|uniref:Uncharacterized protein n=1 Tax=Petrolisthes manimaculis TaxID=1843537 RepID=A0AAE1Q876_9EUCA|nr:hypothetical protein Pmani_007624 [Petrolisthes manimaculis]
MSTVRPTTSKRQVRATMEIYRPPAARNTRVQNTYSREISRRDTSTTASTLQRQITTTTTHNNNDSWDNMYNDQGDCLNPQQQQQLNQHHHPNKNAKETKKKYTNNNNTTTNNNNYTTTTTTNNNNNEEEEEEEEEGEYAHVIELYDFPSSFTTQDLLVMLSGGGFQSTEFKVKWVDDTHALAIFSTARVASRALNTKHPFIKTRSLATAITASRVKAMRGTEKTRRFLTKTRFPAKTRFPEARRSPVETRRSPVETRRSPVETRRSPEVYKPRPPTSVTVARRMILGGLGIHVRVSREDREAERRMLQEARAQKTLRGKQQQDAWEGHKTT